MLQWNGRVPDHHWLSGNFWAILVAVPYIDEAVCAGIRQFFGLAQLAVVLHMLTIRIPFDLTIHHGHLTSAAM